MDKEKLSKLFSTFAEQQTEGTEISFDSDLSDTLRSRIKKELITNAVKDAYDKAHIIANAAMLKIKTVKEINYNTSMPAIQFRGARTDAKGGRYNTRFFDEGSSSIDAQEIELSEDVSIVFLVE